MISLPLIRPSGRSRLGSLPVSRKAVLSGTLPTSRRPPGDTGPQSLAVPLSAHDLLPEPSYGPDPQEQVPRPLMLQTWSSTTFLHWAYEAETVAKQIPDGLQVDTFEGAAWVSLTPFVLTQLRPPGLPALPWISTTPETNVRTYVRGPDGKRGIWFFSLDIGRLPAVLFGRAVYFLPYMWTDMHVDEDGDRTRYAGRRRGPGEHGTYDITVQRGPAFEQEELTELDHFLTARWVLYTFYGPIVAKSLAQHERWPLQRARVIDMQENLVAAAGLPAPVGDPLVHFASDVHVNISRPYVVSPPSSGRPIR